jgi:hypothetical protein
METVSKQNHFDIPHRKEDSTYYNLQRMNQLHHEIVRRIVLGQKDIEIAESLGCTTQTVRYTRTSPVVKQKLEIMMGARDASVLEVRKRIQHLAPLALHKLEEILMNDKASEAVQTKIAQDLLDRAGFDPIKKSLDLTKFSREKIDEIKARARQNGLTVKEEVEEANVVDDDEEESL